MEQDLINNKCLDELCYDFTSLKSTISDVWKGQASSSFNVNFSKSIKAIESVYESLNTFNNILSQLEIYKENKTKIANLEAQIENERNNPSLKTTESYVENGVSKTRDKYVIDYALINSLQREMENLINENNRLKEELNSMCESLVSSNTSSNLQPKNNSDISHRGYSPGGVRDNSIEAFRLAGENGFWGCETDVRFDSNGNLICSHNPPKSGENPPSFAEYLDICKEYGMTAIIDLKYAKGVGPADPYLSPAILQVIREKDMMDSCILQTNNHTDIPYIRENAADARIWYLTDSSSTNTIEFMKANGVECCNIQSGQNDMNGFKRLMDNGIDVCVWNVQSQDSKNRLLSNGIKYVMSDNVLGIKPYQEGEEDFNSKDE